MIQKAEINSEDIVANTRIVNENKTKIKVEKSKSLVQELKVN